MKLSGRIFLCLVVLSLPLTLSAKLLESASAESYWYLQTSILTKHFNPKPEHNNNQKLIGIERNRADRYLWGGATFLNSFDQRSYYIYVGKRYDFANTPFYSKLTGGFIHGYKGEYRDKIPFNNLGVAPVILPSVGVKFKNTQAEAILLGANAMIITIGLKI
ncbi:MAG TPA: sn-glycerol-3-phosphate transporter [Marinospirillum sp.]|uniref:sn-glycerol-3-phosphate transporter n=1 Tax=Marinospirillum sp. TaxID=2183934 RepID=UPI002B476CBB|nr:sn-glycerol-3-phosphate transporter [Marinospirillum sp.]HKM16186.1 sn-glycerol-3-phosphate transporter [Marinospirillum sp.]